MIILFTETERARLQIQPAARQAYSPEYIAERESVWAAQLEKVLARGGKMWNGEVYTLKEICAPGEAQDIILRMSTCEYKDIVFRSLAGQDHVASKYGEAYLCRFSGVNCLPLTSDGKYVFGMRADRPEQGDLIGGIGGTLSKDEMEIHSFVDIRQFALRELQEETALECRAEDLKFCWLYSAAYSYHFWFTVRLPVHSTDIARWHRQGEFGSLVAITEQEAWGMTRPMSTAFRRWRPYLHLLPGIADHSVDLLGMGHSC